MAFNAEALVSTQRVPVLAPVSTWESSIHLEAVLASTLSRSAEAGSGASRRASRWPAAVESKLEGHVPRGFPLIPNWEVPTIPAWLVSSPHALVALAALVWSSVQAWDDTAEGLAWESKGTVFQEVSNGEWVNNIGLEACYTLGMKGHNDERDNEDSSNDCSSITCACGW